ncbi:hypothetical protein GFY24_14565 [Nocardia sp. SYP-A9097]|uniref:DUF7373 family lipoprotein n=1 Tax=Nocardia sp. SYP-A9097 TaxID=2663237 RepID=UPI00129AC1A5|nr:hypothetical protein [Nocardia sp. SYP-A9097]MRH88652.1 hypothetical protein [Nocardia sp. SYP-A9097]
MSASCGSDSQATDHDQPLDVGSYSTQRADSGFDDRPSRARGIMVESLRLGERIVFGSDVAPEFQAGLGGNVIATDDGIRNSDGVFAEALVAHHPLAAYIAASAQTPYVGEYHKTYTLSVALVAFPDEQSATDAAIDMNQNDFAANAKNQAVSIPDYPGAQSHWRPGVPNLGSWLAVKSVVIAVYVEAPQADLDQLTSFVTRTYKQQVPKLDGYVPTPADQQPMLKLDPDKVLTRLVATSDQRLDPRQFAVYSPRGYAVLGTDPAADTRDYDSHGVTAIAVSDNKYLYRMRDAAAATGFAAHLADEPTVSKYIPIPGVSGAPNTSCFKATRPNPTVAGARQFRCLITYEGFVAEVFSDQEPVVRQLAAAQYVLLKDGK